MENILIMEEEKKETGGFFRKFMKRGGAGVLAAVLIILIFLICATWLRSLVFGVLLACVLLPVERFYLDKVFCHNEKKGWFLRFKERFSKKELTPEEQEKQLKQQRVFKASFAALMTLFAVILLVTILAFAVLIPYAKSAKNAITEWGKKSPTVTKVENYLLETKSHQEENEEPRGILVSFRQNLKALAEENKDTLTSFAIARGKDVFSVIYRLLKGLGYLLLDITLSIFFGFYFLQKIAMFEGSGKERRERTSEWFVNQFYNSPWLPTVSESTKNQAVRILNHINVILSRWVRGYFIVIMIEFVLYTLLFTAGGIPYPLLAGSVACLAILLPFIGPVISFTLTACLCIAFCDSSLFLTLIFVCVIYLLINGLLEQFFLYPVFIGEVSGLTSVETIIVVLIGGLVAGISGMIFAVPAAAIIKYIIPEIYKATSSTESTEKMLQKESL